jgi:iron-sulfur cluster assembly accessory protein
MRLIATNLDFRPAIARAQSIPSRHNAGAPVDLPPQRDNLATLMINVTDNAVRQLRSLLETQSETEGKGLRVQIAKGGCSGLQYEMSLDSRKEGDAVVARDGVEFLVDDESAQLLRGATLDYHDGLTGTGFQIVNPNAARTCGCGTSFEPARPA